MRFLIAGGIFVLCITVTFYHHRNARSASSYAALLLSRSRALETDLESFYALVSYPKSGQFELASAVDVVEPDSGYALRTSDLAEPDADSRPNASMDEVCAVLAAAALANDIPVSFFARLIWQESRFRPTEISPAGAQGVAQFMPKTALEFGLDDPFDPLKALPASARFLRQLHKQFGNLGLAAAAYNAGSDRIQNWLARRQGLPAETKNYVRIITGTDAEKWANGSSRVGLDLQLPRNAPCEGVAGLSRAEQTAAIPVTLSPAIGELIKKARLEAQRVAMAAKKHSTKSRLALARSIKLARLSKAYSNTLAQNVISRHHQAAAKIRLAAADAR